MWFRWSFFYFLLFTELSITEISTTCHWTNRLHRLYNFIEYDYTFTYNVNIVNTYCMYIYFNTLQNYDSRVCLVVVNSSADIITNISSKYIYIYRYNMTYYMNISTIGYVQKNALFFGGGEEIRFEVSF